MRAIYVALIGVLIVSGAVFQTPGARAQTPDPGAGVVLGGAGAGPQAPVACTLTVSPNVVSNGEAFQVSVSYSPPIGPGSWTEKFIFNWPSISANFDEKTVRTKMFIDNPSVVLSSS